MISYTDLDEYDARRRGPDTIVVSIQWDPFDLTQAEATELHRKLGEALDGQHST